MRPALLITAGILASACIVVRSTRIDPLTPAEGVQVKSRVRAHLADGSTVLYPKGVRFRNGWLVGSGQQFDLQMRPGRPVDSIGLDRVLAMESYKSQVDAAASTVTLILVPVGAALGAVAIACAIDPKCFGSCPTVYSDSAGTAVLEAEGFSYSVARLFEARDVDRLRATPDDKGTLRLEVRNEALETHFINHLELLAVSHDSDERALPDRDGSPVLARRLAPVRSAVSRSGASVMSVLGSADGVTYRTDSTVLRRINETDLEDFIDLEVQSGRSDSLALAFRLRNSLLNTVLFYDLLIAGRGPAALDWMAEDLESLGPATAMGRFAREHMGLRVSVADGDGWREVARVPDTGPVAWKEVAVVIPAQHGNVTRVRLSFIADNWRIDQVLGTSAWRRGVPRPIEIARVMAVHGASDTVARASLLHPDERYLETIAAQRFFAEFNVGASQSPRTFFLASQGYYTEWVRRSWLGTPPPGGPIPLGPRLLSEAVQRWRVSQDSTERLFYATRVPVR